MGTSLSDPSRLATLRATHLLDTPPEANFDRLTRLAAKLIGAPVVLVSLVDDERQFFKSSSGLGEPLASARGTPISHSFCQHVVVSSAPLIIEDATQHPLVRDNPSVPDHGIIAYAGVPVQIDGNDIGAFCAIDMKPRHWSPEDIEVLEEIARSVVSEIELRTALHELRAREAFLQAIYDASPVAIGLTDLRGHIIGQNKAYRDLLGFSEEELRGKHVSELAPDEDRNGERLILTQGPAGLPGFHRDKRYVRKDGSCFTGRLSSAYVLDGDGEPMSMTGMIIDVTEERRVADALMLSEATSRAMIENVPDGAVLLIDSQLRFVAASGPALPLVLQIARVPDLVGRRVQDVASGPERAEIVRIYSEAVAGTPHRREMVRAGRTFELRAVPLADGAHAMIFLYDITERKTETETLRRLHRDLSGERKMFATTLAHLHDGVALLDADQRILLANDKCGELLGMSDLVGSDLDATPPVVNDEIVVGRSTLTRALSSVPLSDGAGYVVVWRDVTAERDLARQRERDLLTDALTGIPNRRAAERALEVELSRMQRTQSRLSVALLDVDHFKRVNDHHGHAAGDEVLRHVAAAVAAAARKTDVVARWGGEELIAILPVGIEGAHVFCDRAREAVSAIDFGAVGRVTLSAGAAEVVASEPVSEAMARADSQLYAAKRGGRNCTRTVPITIPDFPHDDLP